MPDLLYRYEDVAYAAPFDDTGRLPGTVKVELRTYQVIRRTPHGAWISLGPMNAMDDIRGTERFIRTDARRRFACPTLDEARESFIARKRRQMAIHQAVVERARWAIAEQVRMAKEPGHGDCVPASDHRYSAERPER